MTVHSLPTNWLHAIDQVAPLLGHRNWVVVADAAYPMQCAPGIQTIVADCDPIDALGAVMHRLTSARHVRPIAHLDSEIDYVADADLPDAAHYIGRLLSALGDIEVVREPHEEIIAKIDRAGARFNVLIVKTRALVPYTSVFFELDCGYWTSEAEARLRARRGGRRRELRPNQSRRTWRQPIARGRTGDPDAAPKLRPILRVTP